MVIKYYHSINVSRQIFVTLGITVRLKSHKNVWGSFISKKCNIIEIRHEQIHVWCLTLNLGSLLGFLRFEREIKIKSKTTFLAAMLPL